MSTRVSRKFRLVLAAVGTVGAVYAAVTGVMVAVSELSERYLGSYPWRSEDYMRYLMPSLFGGNGADRILIAGPSEAREDLLYESFEAAFPGRRTLQGGLSLGVFRDLLLALEYWEKTFGAEAVPRTLVLGITTRWVANIPRSESPLSKTITRYSPRYRVVATSEGAVLTEKSALERATSLVRLLDKQPPRYRATVCTVFQRALGGGGSVAARVRTGVSERPSGVARLLGFLEECRSPYKYHHLGPMRLDNIENWMSDPTSFWYLTHHWQPEADAAMVAAEFARLQAIAKRLDIDVFIVNLPEHPSNRGRFDPAAYARYETLLAEATRGWPVLDLRALLPASDFYDAGHATARGAVRVTDETIRFMTRELATRGEVGPRSRASVPAGDEQDAAVRKSSGMEPGGR